MIPVLESALKLFSHGVPVRDIAAITNVSYGVLYKSLDRAGLQRRIIHLDISDKDIATEYLKGKSALAVANIFGCSETRILNSLHRTGIVRRSFKVVSSETREAMVSTYLTGSAGYSKADAAKCYGYSASTCLRALIVTGTPRRTPAQIAKLKRPFDEHFFDIIDTEEKAYWPQILYGSAFWGS